MKRVLSIVLSLVMVIGIIATIPFTASADTLQQDANGFYLIDSYTKLKEFAQIVNGGDTDANAKLTSDITATDTAWTPIGNETKKYGGTFDGDGHKITGLTTPTDYGAFAGLFGYVNTGGVIKNVGLEGGAINGKRYVGGVAGHNRGIIQNCYNSSDVCSSGYNVGGIVGDNYSATIVNCYNTGKIKGEDSTGGIVGYSLGSYDDPANITNCYNTGEVIENYDCGGVGGIAGGFCSSLNGKANITNCYNTGIINVTGQDANAGGIVGYNSAATNGIISLTNCYNTGIIKTSDDGTIAGGIVAYNNASTEGSSIFKNCYYDNSVCSAEDVIGDSFGNTSTTNTKGMTTAEMTGTKALTNMEFSDNSVWLVKADGNDETSGKYYWFYPHLKGFDYNNSGEQISAESISPAYWPAKAEVSVTWSEPESYEYTGSHLAPTASSVTVGSVNLSDTEYDLSLFDDESNPVSESVAYGDYKAVVSFTAPGHADIEKEYKITLIKPEITVTATSTVKLGQKLTITVNYPADADVDSTVDGKGWVDIIIDGNPIDSVCGENGTFTYEITIDSSFNLGEHTVKAMFDSDGVKYSSNSDTTTFTVVSASYTITFVNEDGTQLQSGQVEYGQTPVYNGKTPEKDSNAQYSYSFAGWDNDIAPVTGDATYKATYTKTVNKYTVKFVNEDGTELQSGQVEYGQTPVYNGQTPEKAADAQYTYTFDKWDEDIESVTEDVTYTATYTKTVNEYTVKFLDDDGSELQSEILPYGTTPEYKGEEPVKASDGKYVYEFEGWDKDIEPVTGDASYTAVYKATEIEYSFKTEGTPEWTSGSDDDMLFSVSRSINDDETFDKFIGIEVDGNPVSGEYYTATKGSVNIALSSDYLNTLSPGEHTLKVIFSDGEVERKFNIKAADNNQEPETVTEEDDNTPANTDNTSPADSSSVPNTGDDFCMAVYMLLIIAMGLVYAACIRRKKPAKHNG